MWKVEDSLLTTELLSFSQRMDTDEVIIHRGLEGVVVDTPRSTGWTAHILEPLAHNRLLRPFSQHTGPGERRVTSLSQRG